MARLMPVAMIVAVIGMIALYLTSGAARSPMFLLFPAMMAMSLLGTLAYGSAGPAASRRSTAAGPNTCAIWMPARRAGRIRRRTLPPPAPHASRPGGAVVAGRKPATG